MDQSRVREQEKEKRDSEATSKETLHDLQENEKLSDQTSRETVKSPDGSLDEADELDKAGPM
jgi:hypothetical protein